MVTPHHGTTGPGDQHGAEGSQLPQRALALGSYPPPAIPISWFLFHSPRLPLNPPLGVGESPSNRGYTRNWEGGVWGWVLLGNPGRTEPADLDLGQESRGNFIIIIIILTQG